MFNFIVNIAIVLLALIILSLVLLGLAKLTGMIPDYKEAADLNGPDEYDGEDDDEDDDEYDEDDEDDDDDDSPNSKVAVELIPSIPFGPMTFETADAILRIEHGNCFRDDWYEKSRRNFSAWAADEWQKIAVNRREMGLAA